MRGCPSPLGELRLWGGSCCPVGGCGAEPWLAGPHCACLSLPCCPLGPRGPNLPWHLKLPEPGSRAQLGVSEGVRLAPAVCVGPGPCPHLPPCPAVAPIPSSSTVAAPGGPGASCPAAGSGTSPPRGTRGYKCHHRLPGPSSGAGLCGGLRRTASHHAVPQGSVLTRRAVPCHVRGYILPVQGLSRAGWPCRAVPGPALSSRWHHGAAGARPQVPPSPTTAPSHPAGPSRPFLPHRQHTR